MRKHFVKILSIFIIATLLYATTSGCKGSALEDWDKADSSSSGPEQATAVSETAVGKPEILEITRASYFGDITEYPELKSEFMVEFEKKFNVKLKVNALPANGYTDKVSLLVSSGDIKGLVNLYMPSDVLRYKNDGAIEKLDDYLTGNIVWEQMDEVYKKLFYFDNSTWGIGMAYGGSVFARSFRQDWLDSLGLEVPDNVDELAEVARAFTENDPDGNGQNDTYGLTGAGTGWNLQDIFQAFGARLDNTGSSSIVWDPDTNSWIDTMLKPEMINALKFVNKLYTAKYIDPEIFTNKSSIMREKMTASKAGSLFYWQDWAKNNEASLKKTVPDASVTEILALKGKKTTNLNQYVLTGTPYVLLKGTSMPRETINTFFNLFIGNKDAYTMGRFGIEGKTYRIENDEIIWLMNSSTGSPMMDARIVGEFPQYNYSKMPWVYEGTAKEMEASRASNKARQTELEKAIDSRLVFVCPYDTCISNTRSKVEEDAEKIFTEAFVKAVMGEVTVEDAVKKYREEMKAIGGDTILKEANKANGLQNTMTY